MNIYSDSSHLALKYLKDTEMNIHNLLIMAGNFNIRDSLWDSSFSYHLSISNDRIIIADSFNLELLCYNTVCYGTNSRVRVRDRDRTVVYISLQQIKRDRR